MTPLLSLFLLTGAMDACGQESVSRSSAFSKLEVDWTNTYKPYDIPSEAYYINESLLTTHDNNNRVIQQAINKHSVVVLPDIPIHIGDEGITLRNNSVLIFQKKTQLILNPSAKGSYSLLKLYNVKNVKVINPFLIGDRELHLGTSGEWGMGIDIRSAENVKLYNPRIRDMWGDGIYLGKINRTNFSVSIIDGIIDYSRRNGISLTSGESIEIIGTKIYNTYGVKPMAGIDIEPNKESERVDKISLINITTVNNYNEGVLLYLSNLRHINTKRADIFIKGFKDRGSGTGLRIGDISYEGASGNIEMQKLDVSGNRLRPIRIGDIDNTKVKIRVNGLSVDGRSIESKNDLEKDVFKSNRNVNLSLD